MRPPYLGWYPVEVLPQHPPHVFAGVRGHLVLEEEGELATLADAVEVAVHLVVLATCNEREADAVVNKKERRKVRRCRVSVRVCVCVIRSNPG